MAWKHWEVVLEIEDGGRPLGEASSYLTAVQLKKLIESFLLHDNIGHTVVTIKEIIHDKASFKLYEEGWDKE